MNTTRLCWLDLRRAGALTDADLRDAVRAEAIHHGVDAIVADTVADLESLPPTVVAVLMPSAAELPEDLGPARIVIVDPNRHGEPADLAAEHPGVEFGRYVRVVDAGTLDQACHSARSEPWSVLEFSDTTKIPLEIVLAAAADAKGRVVTMAADPDEATLLFGVLEHGTDGVMMAPRALGDATRLTAATRARSADIPLVELEITGVSYAGMGERACVDTCSWLRPDEGILVGSFSKGLILCASETHPLPYMPTRPFRVNAGAIMSYTLGDAERTRYLSELRAGSTVLAVDATGRTRPVTVGRTKIEARPLLAIDAVAADGRTVNLIVQNDWHVRVVGPGGVVLNSTALRPGDKVLGHLPTKDRHVGYAIDETCLEQ
jgi:3-amino-4-hydroxybenzoic acid synthase